MPRSAWGRSGSTGRSKNVPLIPLLEVAIAGLALVKAVLEMMQAAGLM